MYSPYASIPSRNVYFRQNKGKQMPSTKKNWIEGRYVLCYHIMSSIELLPHLFLRIYLLITQKKQMQADADKTELHGKELDRREVRIMIAYYVFH